MKGCLDESYYSECGDEVLSGIMGGRLQCGEETGQTQRKRLGGGLMVALLVEGVASSEVHRVDQTD